ncbi:hypothetical protein KIH74_18650 [Kineosporia sp. J2-2]|uniref:ATP-binding protein n=1 Tax=Kineosporia corallincola TaxID=2835133 RepID=A0ABS5TIX6_9ACTN|nr:hypothetical protein [Kineosporia corallincola]MBT0770965.1 hypothetical protein [Kineosporia corallincola]
MTELTSSEYRSLIQSSVPTTVDADTKDPDFAGLFTPDNHRLALDPDVTLVQGARGSGKTVWFKALHRENLRSLAAVEYRLESLRRIQPLSGYGSERQPDSYPGPSVLRALLADGRQSTAIWTAVLLQGLRSAPVVSAATWAEKVRWVEDSPEDLERELAAADQRLAAENRQSLILFDALDRLHEDREQANHLIEGILRLALDLRTGYRRLRAKIFIRPDMLTASSFTFADASKLIANAAELTWSETNLYGLFFHHLGNGDPELSARFRQHSAPGTWLLQPAEEDAEERYVMPTRVASDATSQRELFVGIAGPYMGLDHRKGHTYSWLPNHLMDGSRQVSPRSFLSALSNAAENTASRYGGHSYALHYDAIRSGVQHASQIRVGEMREDIPWVGVAVEELAGLQVPMEREILVERWAGESFWERVAPVSPDDEDSDDDIRTGPRARTPDGLIDELRNLGVMSFRSDGRIDLPDVYRIAFDIGRKGGVPRVRRR